MSVAKPKRSWDTYFGILMVVGENEDLRITSATIVRACSAIQTCVQSFFCASSEEVQNNA